MNKNENMENEKIDNIIQQLNIESKSDSEILIEKKDKTNTNKNLYKNININKNKNNNKYNRNYDYSYIKGLGNIIVFKSYNGFQVNNKKNIHRNISHKTQLQETKDDEEYINLIKQQIKEKIYNDSETEEINHKNKDLTIIEIKAEENNEKKILEEKMGNNKEEEKETKFKKEKEEEKETEIEIKEDKKEIEIEIKEEVQKEEKEEKNEKEKNEEEKKRRR